MKTRKQKVICRVLCMVVSIFLLASFFVVPVMAEVDKLSAVKLENIMYDYGPDQGGLDQRPYLSVYLGTFGANMAWNSFNRVTSSNDSWRLPKSIVNDDSYMTFSYRFNPDTSNLKLVYYINQLFDDGVIRSFSKGDTCYIEPAYLGVWFDTDSEFTEYRFTLRDNGDPYSFSFGSVVASTDVISVNFDDGDEGIDFDRLPFTFANDIQSNSLCLCIEFTCLSNELDFSVSFEAGYFSVQYGSGVSPNYPIYPAAPGGNDVGNYGSAEQELIQSQEQGLSQGANSMQSAGSNLQSLSSDLKLMSFVPVLSGALDKIATIPGIMPLVNISLSLGLFASLMGLAASIVSAADRRAGQAKREAQRESRKK